MACVSVGGRGEMRTKFWMGSLKRRDHSKDLGVDGRIKVDFKQMGY
jgi:hypothetical protein